MVAPAGRARRAVLRALAGAMPVLASAPVAVGLSERHNTSGALSPVLAPHAPVFAVPVSGAGTPPRQSKPNVLPMMWKSPF